MILTSKGKEVERTVEETGGKEKTITFLGADRSGVDARFGIGIMLPQHDKAFFWGVLRNNPWERHELIASWRAWRILEHTWYIGNTTFAACLASGHHEIEEHDQEYVDVLWRQFGGLFLECREEALASLPTHEELAILTHILTCHEIPYSAREIVRKYKRLRVSVPEYIANLAHQEPAGTLWERCSQLAHTMFHS